MKSSRKALLLIIVPALQTQVLFAEHGVFNTRAMYFDTEELWFPEWDNRGTP